MGKIKDLLLEEQHKEMIDTDYFFEKDTNQLKIKVEKLPKGWSDSVMKKIIWGQPTCKSSPACEEDVCRCEEYYKDNGEF